MKPVFDYIRIGRDYPQMSLWGTDNNHYNRLHIPLSGKATISIGKEYSQIMEPGYAYFLPSYSDLVLSVEPGEEYDHLYMDVYVSPLVISKHPRVIKLSDDKVMESFAQAFENIFNEISIMNCFISSINPPPAYFKKFSDSILLYIFERYYVRFSEDNLLTKAIRYIYDHYSENISNEDIAASVHVHTRHLVRIFNENLNITPHKFLIDLRVTRAKAMLAEGKTAKDVCYCCGFGNPKTFGETFKRETGLSISEYVDKLKNG